MFSSKLSLFTAAHNWQYSLRCPAVNSHEWNLNHVSIDYLHEHDEWSFFSSRNGEDQGVCVTWPHTPQPVIYPELSGFTILHEIDVVTSKRRLSITVQGRSFSILWLADTLESYHNHMRRKARENLPRCRMPSPPSFFGLVARIQPTLHFPPVNLSVPAQRNCLCFVSIGFITSLGGLRASST